MNFKKLFFMLTFLVLLGTTAFAQQTWYVNNGPTGNDGRNGLSATIPVPDDFVTGPKKTINNAISSANAGDVIVVAFTGVDYGIGTGEPATIQASKVLTFQSRAGNDPAVPASAPGISSVFEVVTGALANNVTFNSGNFNLKGGLTLTSGTLVNSSGLVNVGGGTITVAAINTTTRVNGQLTFSGTVNWNYTAVYTTADEFPNAGGTINDFNSGAVAVTVKSGSSVTMTGDFGTGGALNLGGNTWTITNTGVMTHTIGGNITNGTLAFSLGGGDVEINGAFTLPTITVATSTSTARTLEFDGPTAITGTISVSGLASVTGTGNSVATLGTSGYTGNVLTMSSTGAFNLGTALVTVHGNVLLNTAVTAATNSSIAFTNGAPLTINGSVTNNASLTVTNANTWNGASSGRITFPDQDLTITGNLVNGTTIGGALGATLDVDGFGLIVLQNAATDVVINGAINNTSSTSISGSTNPADFSGNGLIVNNNNLTTGIVRADGGINNSSDFSGITGAANANNGRIVIGGAARTGISTVGTTGNPVGLITNSSKGRAAGDGNGDIIIGVGDGTSSGFYGSSINISGTGVGGYTIFGNELFDLTGSISNSRTHASTALAIGVAGTAVRTVTVDGNIVNSGTNTTSFVVSTTGDVLVTGRVESTANGTITWPNITSGNFSIGGLNVSAGTITKPATHSGTTSINGNIAISGGNVNLLNDGSNPAITVAANSASFTGGTITTTGVTALTLNVPSIIYGGATTNPTFATATTAIIVGVPAPVQLVNFQIGDANPLVAGALTVNSSGLARAVEFTGGSLRVAGLLTFQAGKVHLTGAANILAQANTGTNDFQNVAGYTTDDNARVTLNATSPQVTGAGDFGNFEINCATAGATDIGSAITVKGTLYLTQGPVDNTVNNVTFDNTTVLPTIVRNAGYFMAVPTFTSNVNVTYIGGDKLAGNELPVAPSTKLQNLTVATSIGNVAGKGVVTVGANTIVNGTINVYANQALLIDAATLTMNGAAITLNGDIANEGAGKLVFGAAAGTVVTGSGYLPNLEVAAGSSGNVIAGRAIIDQLLGTDNMRSGDDFDPATTTAQGTVNFVAGTNNALFTLLGVGFDGSMAGNVTTNATGNTMILGGNFVSAGTLTHNAGTINVDTFTYEQRGAAIALGTTANAAFSGSGKLYFYQKDATTNTPFTLTSAGGGSTIAINTELNNADADAGDDDLILAGGPLTISGNLTITDGELVLNQNLTLTGSAFTIAAAGSSSGASVLRLNAATPPMVFTYSGTPTVANLRISNDVDLAGNGTSLTVTTLFTHDGGVLNFGSRNLTFQTAFVRTAGTYTGTTGYMIFNANIGWTVDQGDGFSIPNLRFTESGSNLALSNAAGRGTITVTGAMDIVLGAQTLTTNGKLAVADGATVNYTSGALSASPAYAGGITLVALNTAAGPVTIPANIWPTTADLVQTFRVQAAAAANVVRLPGSRTVFGTNTLDLRVGSLDLQNNVLTLVSGTTIRRRDNARVFTAGTGSIAFPADNNVNLVYESSTAGNGVNGAFPDPDITTGLELPAVMNNLTVTRSANVGNSTLLINSAATVNGDLVIKNDITAAAQLTVKGNVSIVTDDTNTNAGAPVVTFAQAAPLVFGGATGQQLDVTGGQNIAWMRLNMTGVNPVLNVIGGNLTIPNAGGLLFTNGILNMGDNKLILPRPNAAVNFQGLAYDRSAVTGTNVGHVVGKIERAAVAGDGAAGTNGRFEFPVGTLTGEYRPAAITFTPAYVVGNPVNIIVSHVDASPEGTVNLPLDGGNGVKVGNYPNFYWLVSTFPTNLTSTQGFDVDLQANNIGYPYASDTQLRIIRRQDGSALSNGWLMQGIANNYANYQVVQGVDTTVVVRTVSSQGGLVAQGSRFSIGVPTRAPLFTAPTDAEFTVAENTTLDVQFTADPRDVGETVSYAIVSGPSFATINATTGLVTLTPDYSHGRVAPYPLVVRATDSGNQTADITVDVIVTEINRAPSFDGDGAAKLADVTIKDNETLSFTYVAVDADGNTVTYNLLSVEPTFAGTATLASALGTLQFAPAFADAGKAFTVTVEATDGDMADTTSAVVTVNYSVEKGDVSGNGSIAADDASEILKYVVGLVTFTDKQLYAADVNNDGVVGALDAAWVLYYVVNGSWPTAKLSAAAGIAEFGSMVSENGIISLPISLANTSGVLSAKVELDVNGALEIEGVASRLPEGWIMVSKLEEGRITLAMAGLKPLADGSFATVNFKVQDKDAKAVVQGKANLNDEYSAQLNSVTVKEIPTEFELSQNYPNPFNPVTNIKFSLPENANVNLTIYNMLGQKVKTLLSGEQEAGFYTVRWDGTNELGSRVSSGIYIYRIEAGKYTSTMKMNLLK